MPMLVSWERAEVCGCRAAIGGPLAVACWEGMKRTQSVRKSEILIFKTLEWIVSLCAWIVVDFWALFLSRYPDKGNQSGDAPQDSVLTRCRTRACRSIWGCLAGRRADFGVERHDNNLPVVRTCWRQLGRWTRCWRAFLALLKILHCILLAVGHYWWFLRKKARRCSLWFRERLSLEWRTQRRNRFRKGGIRQQCGGSGRHWPKLEE